MQRVTTAISSPRLFLMLILWVDVNILTGDKADGPLFQAAQLSDPKKSLCTRIFEGWYPGDQKSAGI